MRYARTVNERMILMHTGCGGARLVDIPIIDRLPRICQYVTRVM